MQRQLPMKSCSKPKQWLACGDEEVMRIGLVATAAAVHAESADHGFSNRKLVMSYAIALGIALGTCHGWLVGDQRQLSATSASATFWTPVADSWLLGSQ
jgi:hypothetical protein